MSLNSGIAIALVGASVFCCAFAKGKRDDARAADRFETQAQAAKRLRQQLRPGLTALAIETPHSFLYLQHPTQHAGFLQKPCVTQGGRPVHTIIIPFGTAFSFSFLDHNRR